MRKNIPAFTLIEILVVTTILAIAAVIAVPSIASGFDNVRVPSAARMVMSDILLAQNTAITTQTPTYIFFINDEGGVRGYTIVRFKGVTAAAPNLAAAVAANETFTDTSTTIYLRSPSARRGCYVNFGARPPGGMGPLGACVLSNVSVTGFGFGSLGQPIDTAGADLAAAVTITLANGRGNVSNTLTVAQITGEISVQ